MNPLCGRKRMRLFRSCLRPSLKQSGMRYFFLLPNYWILYFQIIIQGGKNSFVILKQFKAVISAPMSRKLYIAFMCVLPFSCLKSLSSQEFAVAPEFVVNPGIVLDNSYSYTDGKLLACGRWMKSKIKSDRNQIFTWVLFHASSSSNHGPQEWPRQKDGFSKPCSHLGKVCTSPPVGPAFQARVTTAANHFLALHLFFVAFPESKAM